MRKRTQSREIALKILYAWEMTKDDIASVAGSHLIEEAVDDKDVSAFAVQLVNGVSANVSVIDNIITKYATNWKIERMAVIDRNILRLAAYELMYMKDTPPKVCINEAINIAKKYGNPDSSKFVNGILDKICRAVEKDEKVSSND